VLDAGFSQRNLGFDTDLGPVRAVGSEMPKDPTFFDKFLRFLLAIHHSAIVPHSATPPTEVRTNPDSSAYYQILVSELVGGGSFLICHVKGHRKEKNSFIGTRKLISTTELATE